MPGKTSFLTLFLIGAVVSGSALAQATATAPAKDSGKARAAATKAVIPVFELSGPVTEKAVADDFPFSFGAMGESLKSLTDRLSKVIDDEDVPAIVLFADSAQVGRAQQQELRRVLAAIRAAGKQIHVHSELFTTGEFVLMSGASEISMVPTGYMFITGLYGEQMFLRGLLDKVGVTPDYFTCGDFKTAAEMFMRKEPSAQSKEMSDWLYGGIFDELITDVAEGRGVEKVVVKGWIDEGVFTAERAVEKGIIDVVEHRQDFEDRLKKLYGDDLKFDRKYGKKKGTEIDLSSPFGILNFYAELLSPPSTKASTKPGVAIVYLEGSILPGSSQGNPFLADAAAFSDSIRKALDEAANDEAVKAVVFRVNSPGGSAVASEIILNATRRVAARKPFVVSMGDVAGSGGYYVACGANTIFVDPSTITGSIGVVAGKFATTGLWDKVGINWSPIAHGRNAAILSSSDVFSDSERLAMQSYMDEVYEVFKGHVVKARGDRLKKDIDELAGGRVYTGRQAIELGLADEFGGLADAVAFAAKEASLEEGYDVRIVPRPKNFMEALMSDLSGPKDDGRHLQMGLPGGFAQSQPLIDTVLPLLNGIDPQRMSAIKQALLQMSILQKEHVSLMMPVMSFAP